MNPSFPPNPQGRLPTPHPSNAGPLIPGGAPGAPPPSNICPRGLECLIPLGSVFVKQEIEVMEIVLNVETNNKYSVFSPNGMIYRAQENNDFMTLNCSCACGTSRVFTILMFDIMNNCIKIECPTAGCEQQVFAYDTMGQLLGSVVQTGGVQTACCCLVCCSPPVFEVLDSNNTSIFRIRAPVMLCNFSDQDFVITTLDETVTVGHINKQFGGFIQESYTDATNFGVSFPVDLDVKLKATLLAACFLIDFMFFEKKPNGNHHRHHHGGFHGGF